MSHYRDDYPCDGSAARGKCSVGTTRPPSSSFIAGRRHIAVREQRTFGRAPAIGNWSDPQCEGYREQPTVVSWPGSNRRAEDIDCSDEHARGPSRRERNGYGVFHRKQRSDSGVSKCADERHAITAKRRSSVGIIASGYGPDKSTCGCLASHLSRMMP